jgi:hypothetical protein
MRHQIETRPNPTLAVELGLVLDRSSSMRGCATDTLRAFNNLLAEQRRLGVAGTRVSLKALTYVGIEIIGQKPR